MHLSPILLLHICVGTLGFLAGAIAISLRKGSRPHGLAGETFVIAMLVLAGSGIYLALVKHRPGDVLGGMLTLYLVITAWRTVQNGDARTDGLDRIVLPVALALLCVITIFGAEAALSPVGSKYGYSVGPYIFLGLVMLVSVAGDIRMLARGGISGIPRIGRHLWRMCFAFFIAAASIFLARKQLFPAILSRTGILTLLTFLPLALMVFWLIRIRFLFAYQEQLRKRKLV